MSNLTLDELTESLGEVVAIVQSMNRDLALLREEIENNRKNLFDLACSRENMIEQMSSKIDSIEKSAAREREHAKNLNADLQGAIRSLSSAVELTLGRNLVVGGRPTYPGHEPAPSQFGFQLDERKNKSCNPHPSAPSNGHFIPNQATHRNNTPQRYKIDVIPFHIMNDKT